MEPKFELTEFIHIALYVFIMAVYALALLALIIGPPWSAICPP